VDAAGSATAITAADVPASTGLSEYITFSRYQNSVALSGFGYEGTTNNEYPGNVARTIPKRDDAAKYSWMKAPRWNDTACEVGPMARMFISGLFKKGAALATSIPSGGGITGYGAYVHPTQPGLDPKMINPDIAVALVRTGAGIATLHGPSGTNVLADYYDPAAYIDGALYLWILNLTAGLSTMDRLRARALESLVLVQKMIGQAAKPTNPSVDPSITFSGGWVADLDAFDPTNVKATFIAKPYPTTGSGFGATEAPRGALMHVCTQEAGKLTKYQCIVPTTWNGSPRGIDADDRGPIEAAIRGTYYSPATTTAKGGRGTTIIAGGGVEALRVAQSFDPCIACAVH
jgi:Ni,Fe-hydrogenase I large subunit